MPITQIQDWNDPRLTVYRDLRNTNLTRQSGRFIAEGLRVVERLLQSKFDVCSILLNQRHENLLAERFSERAEVFVVPEQVATRLVGFPFHEGVLACGRRQENPTLESILSKPAEQQRIVLCYPKITGPDNLGSLVRLAASFGIQGILLGSGSVDPYIRRVIRVSMGTFFNVPICACGDLYDELQQQQKQNQALILAAEKNENSIPLEKFSDLQKKESPVFVLLGNESAGLEKEWLELADKTLHIPIAADVDSLNITHAAAIFLYEITRNSER